MAGVLFFSRAEFYALWATSDTQNSFFYWLDHGDGKDITGAGHGKKAVTREQLEAAEVQYCNKKTRQQFQVSVRDGKLHWINQGMRLCHSSKKAKADGKRVMMIYVMAPNGTLYLGDKKREKFHHSSFLSGSAVIAAGSMCVEHGILREVTPHSGHYRPSADDFKRCIASIESMGVDMTTVSIGKLKERTEKDLTKLLEAGRRKAVHNPQSDEET